MINYKLNELLKLAQGERTQNQFALHCGIGSSTLTRFIKGERVPSPEVLKKIASKSYNGISYEDLMNAVYGTPNEKVNVQKPRLCIALHRISCPLPRLFPKKSSSCSKNFVPYSLKCRIW